MTLDRTRPDQAKGQIIVVFALSLVALMLAVGLVIDGGNAWSQRRITQNAADFAAVAGTKIVAANAGTAQTNAAVQTAVETALASNGMPATTLGTNYTASYVNSAGNLVAGYGSGGNVPAGVIGVQVSPSKQFSTYFLGVAGMTSFSASATATAKYGFYEGTFGSSSGNLVPIAVKLDVIAGLQNCPQGSVIGSGGPCNPVSLTEGNHSAPGQFAWMSWDGTGNTPYLCSILGPPANSPSYTVPSNGFLVISGNTGVSNSSLRTQRNRCVGRDAGDDPGANRVPGPAAQRPELHHGTAILFRGWNAISRHDQWQWGQCNVQRHWLRRLPAHGLQQSVREQPSGSLSTGVLPGSNRWNHGDGKHARRDAGHPAHSLSPAANVKQYREPDAISHPALYLCGPPSARRATSDWLRGSCFPARPTPQRRHR